MADFSFFSLPMDAGPRDQIVGMDELGRPVYRGALGSRYHQAIPPAEDPDMTLAKMLGHDHMLYAPSNPISEFFGGMVSGLKAPGNAAKGENVTMGDAFGTALDYGLLGAPMPKPKGALGANSIRAYHGSPHDFDRFSMDKIGTGEGAQAYGHGLYFAENEAVAKAYRDALAPGMSDGALRAAGVSDGDLRAMRQFTQSAVDPDIALRDWLGWVGKSETPELRAAFMQEWTGRNPGSMYEVEIAADPADFLDWDARFRDLPKSQQDAIEGLLSSKSTPDDDALLAELGVGADFAQNYDPMEGITGAGAYGSLSDPMRYGQIGLVAEARAGVKAAEDLKNAGIPGIKYYDQGSRTTGGTRNYVVFDDKLITILRKYGIGAAVPGLGYALTKDEMGMVEAAQYVDQHG